MNNLPTMALTILCFAFGFMAVYFIVIPPKLNKKYKKKMKRSDVYPVPYKGKW